MLHNTPNQPSKFKAKNWVKINDESRGTYNEVNQIRFKTSLLRSSLCDYSDAHILVKETITVEEETEVAPYNANKKVLFKNCASFRDCISRISNTQVDDAHNIDVVMPTYNLIEYSDIYSKTSGIFWQYARDELADGTIADFTTDNTLTDSIKIKEKLTGKTGNYGTKKLKVMVPLEYLCNFCRTLKMLLINCEINLD